MASSARVSSCPVPGDRDQRVTVALPRHLKELRGRAGKEFKGIYPRQKFNMWLNGTTMLREPQQISSVKDGDVVVLQAEQEQVKEGIWESTAMSEFVEHPLQPKHVRPKDNNPLPTSKFEGISDYQARFINHPRARPEPFRPKSGGLKPEQASFQGQSTYKTEFPGHTQKHEIRKVVDAWKPNSAPFQGQSAYTQDFVKHPLDIYTRKSHKHQRHWIDAPFDGQSTYASEYTKHAGARPSTPWKGPNNRILEQTPFQGDTEYTNAYFKHAMADVHVHLEPALERRPGSAPPRGKVVRKPSATEAELPGAPKA